MFRDKFTIIIKNIFILGSVFRLEFTNYVGTQTSTIVNGLCIIK